MTIKEVSEYLNISEATVRNWVKLGKINGIVKDNITLISSSDIKNFTKALESSNILTSRRNKSRNSSNYIPKSYISSHSPNLKIISSLIKELSNDTNISILEILGYYAKKLMQQANLAAQIINSLAICDNPTGIYNALLSDYDLQYISGEDTLGMLYISLRRLQDKKATGSYYTPYFAVDLLLSQLPADPKDICDPACGTGNFLLRLPSEYSLEMVHGYDIDETAIKIAKINLAIKYQIKTPEQLEVLNENICKRDFLLSYKDDFKFERIIGNPPWGSSFDKAYIAELRAKYDCAKGNGKPESFSLFIEKALDTLTDKGQLYFLLPETLLSSDMHGYIREVLSKEASISNISYLGDIFDNVQCPCIILGASKYQTIDIHTSFYKKEKKETLACLKSFNVPSKRIDKNNFHVLADNDEYELLEKINATPHFTLKGQADFALGIVTGANNAVLSPDQKRGYEPILKGKDIHKFYYDAPSSFIKFEPERFQQVAPEHLYREKEKLFYKFIAGEPVFAYDNRCTLSLNSANILIPRVNGYSAAYIMAILNSDVMSFYYRHTFKNMKMLRSAIESLPIAECDENTMKRISDMALSISNNFENRLDIQNKINERISQIYNIAPNDIKNNA